MLHIDYINPASAITVQYTYIFHDMKIILCNKICISVKLKLQNVVYIYKYIVLRKHVLNTD